MKQTISLILLLALLIIGFSSIYIINEAEQAAIAELRSMDDVLPRPTADAQLELLQRVTTPNDAPEEVNSEFKLS